VDREVSGDDVYEHIYGAWWWSYLTLQIQYSLLFICIDILNVVLSDLQMLWSMKE
jgi:hypothetical protein